MKRDKKGNYYGTAPFLVSPLAGISAYAHTLYSDGSDLAAAAALAATADVAVVRAIVKGEHIVDL